MNPGQIIRLERDKMGWSQADLAKRVGISQPAIRKIESGETLKSKYFPKIAQELGIPLNKLDGSLSPRNNENYFPKIERDDINNQTLQIFPNDNLIGRVDLPVFLIKQNVKGDEVLSADPFTNIARPQNLMSMKDTYGVLVKGNTMALEYNEGDIAYIDPNKYPKEGDPCIFIGKDSNGEQRAILKYLASAPDESDAVWYVKQTNPPKSLTLKKTDWQTCHVAVGKQSGR